MVFFEEEGLVEAGACCGVLVRWRVCGGKLRGSSGAGAPGDALPRFHTCRRLGKLEHLYGETEPSREWDRSASLGAFFWPINRRAFGSALLKR